MVDRRNTCLSCGRRFEYNFPGGAYAKCPTCIALEKQTRALQQGARRDIKIQRPSEVEMAVQSIAAQLRLQARQQAEQEFLDKKREEWENRPCPHCAERINKRAKVCRFCNRDVVDAPDVLAEIQRIEAQAERLGCEPWKVEEVNEERTNRARQLGCAIDQLDEYESRVRMKRLEQEEVERKETLQIAKRAEPYLRDWREMEFYIDGLFFLKIALGFGSITFGFLLSCIFATAFMAKSSGDAEDIVVFVGTGSAFLIVEAVLFVLHRSTRACRRNIIAGLQKADPKNRLKLSIDEAHIDLPGSWWEGLKDRGLIDACAFSAFQGPAFRFRRPHCPSIANESLG